MRLAVEWELRGRTSQMRCGPSEPRAVSQSYMPDLAMCRFSSLKCVQSASRSATVRGSMSSPLIA